MHLKLTVNGSSGLQRDWRKSRQKWSWKTDCERSREARQRLSPISKDGCLVVWRVAWVSICAVVRWAWSWIESDFSTYHLDLVDRCMITVAEIVCIFFLYSM